MKPVISQAEAIRRMERRKPFIALILLAVCVAVFIGLLSMCSKPSGSNHQAPHMSREQILSQAKLKFDAGDGFGALEIIDKNSTSEMLRTDEEIRVLKRTIIASMNADIAPQRAEATVERLDGYWTDQVNGVSAATPGSVSEIMQREMIFQDAAHALEEAAEFADDLKAKAAAAKFRKILVARQIAVFPILRKSYGALVGNAVWRDDVSVITTGRHIRFIGGIFAANANIADAQESVRFNASHLRFSRVEYAWHQRSEVTYYNLETPEDNQIGYWEGEIFKAVKN